MTSSARDDYRRLRLSRTFALQGLSLIAIASFVYFTVVVTNRLDRLPGGWAAGSQVVFVIAMALALRFLPSAWLGAWLKVKVSKHLFQHRYDYRSEWLRFTETIGGDAERPLGERVVKAVADLTDAPAGLLFAPDAAGVVALQARWNWPEPLGGSEWEAAATSLFEETGRIVELDAVRRGGDDARYAPAWLKDEARAWAVVPLVHFERLAGLVVLARPLVDRGLDWEDFDLLRVVGRQAASYLSEARGQEALSDAARFDEFNRRFAFIMHDIKNLVSQLTLVARNAERHADKPEFRADMIATLKDSATRMNELLARLSQHNKGKPEEPRPVAAAALVESVAARKRRQHPVVVSGAPELMALADPARLEQLLGHLIQNAIDASPPGEPVTVTVGQRGLQIAIEVLDNGAGMSAEFVRSQLFRPFASTKQGGFGIGAYEARSLAAQMGGRIEVESHEGEGSRFILILPRAAAEQAA